MTTLDIDNLFSGLNNRVIFTGDNLVESRSGILTAPGVSGLLLNDLSFGVESNYGPLFGNPAGAAVSQGIDTLSLSLSSLGLGNFASAIQDFSPRNLLQTVSSWQGSTRPTFSFNVLFVTLRGTDNILQKVKSLYSMVLPQRTGVGNPNSSIDIGQIRAPLGYFPDASLGARGTMVVSVGSWFLAQNLIARNVSFSFSKETTTNGQPLYAIGTVVLEPFRDISYDEFASFIIESSGV
jgi:hypothetical protein